VNEINRTRSKVSVNNREYKVLSEIIDQDPYWDEGFRYYPKYRQGFKNSKKPLLKYKIRMYRTWKHNRIKQYKN